MLSSQPKPVAENSTHKQSLIVVRLKSLGRVQGYQISLILNLPKNSWKRQIWRNFWKHLFNLVTLIVKIFRENTRNWWHKSRLKLDLVRAFVILEWDCVISRAKWFKPSLITKKAKIHQFCGWKMPILVAKSHSDGTHWICPSVPAASGRNWHKKWKYKIGCSFMYVQHTQMYDTSY